MSRPLGDQDIATELSRRDFTVNAIALPLENWRRPDNLIDPLDGCADLRHRVLRAVTPTIYTDDGIRLMRLARLAGQLGFTIEDENGGNWPNATPLISGTVSPDRLRDELCKVLGLRDAKPALRLLDDIGVLSRIMPELDAARGVTQPVEHYWDVFNHLIETVGFMDGLLDADRRMSDATLSQMPWSENVANYFAEEVSGGADRATLTKTRLPAA